MKLVIEYDPIEGTAIPDGRVSDWVKSIINSATNVDIPTVIIISSSIIIEEIRALVVEEKLSHKDIIFRFEGEDFMINKYGNIKSWPKGFCDIWDNTIERLLTAQDTIARDTKTKSI